MTKQQQQARVSSAEFEAGCVSLNLLPRVVERRRQRRRCIAFHDFCDAASGRRGGGLEERDNGARRQRQRLRPEQVAVGGGVRVDV